MMNFNRFIEPGLIKVTLEEAKAHSKKVAQQQKAAGEKAKKKEQDKAELASLLSTNFHLIGQHDQSSHGRGGGSGRSGKGAKGTPRSVIPHATETSLQRKIDTATKSKSLVGGKSGAAVTMLSGPHGKVVHKTGTTKHVLDSEYLAAQVGKRLGAPVPHIAKVGKNNDELAIDFVEGQMAGTFARGAGRVLPLNRKARSKVVEMEGAKELAMLDIAIWNVDRHGGNVMVHPNGKNVVGIDHGNAFEKIKVFNPATPFESHWKKKFKKDDYDSAIKKLAPLRKEFAASGRSDWYDNMITRLEVQSSRAKPGSMES